MVIKILTAFLATAILIFVIELVRRGKLTFKYAVGWIMISLLGLIFVFFDQWLVAVSYWFGFTLPSNFIFFTLICFFIFLSLFLTIFLCQQNNRNDTMAQKIGLLELEISHLKKQVQDKMAPKNGDRGNS